MEILNNGKFTLLVHLKANQDILDAIESCNLRSYLWGAPSHPGFDGSTKVKAIVTQHIDDVIPKEL
jgi:hypothetical protein